MIGGPAGPGQNHWISPTRHCPALPLGIYGASPWTQAVSASQDACPHPHQAEDWIQEQIQQLKEPIPPGNLKDKSRCLQKQQALEAEIQAQEEVVTSVTKVTVRPQVSALPQSVDSKMAMGEGLK